MAQRRKDCPFRGAAQAAAAASSLAPVTRLARPSVILRCKLCGARYYDGMIPRCKSAGGRSG